MYFTGVYVIKSLNIFILFGLFIPFPPVPWLKQQVDKRKKQHTEITERILFVQLHGLNE